MTRGLGNFPAPIDTEDLAGDHLRAGAKEEDGGAGDVVRFKE